MLEFVLRNGGNIQKEREKDDNGESFEAEEGRKAVGESGREKGKKSLFSRIPFSSPSVLLHSLLLCFCCSVARASLVSVVFRKKRRKEERGKEKKLGRFGLLGCAACSLLSDGLW